MIAEVLWRAIVTESRRESKSKNTQRQVLDHYFKSTQRETPQRRVKEYRLSTSYYDSIRINIIKILRQPEAEVKGQY